MDPELAGLGAGAVLGLLNQQQQLQEAAKQRQYQSMVARFSPWTGQKATPVANPNLIGNLTGGIGTAGGVVQGSKKLQGLLSGGGDEEPTAPDELDPENSTSTGDATAANFRGPSPDRNIMTDKQGNQWSYNPAQPAGGSPWTLLAQNGK